MTVTTLTSANQITIPAAVRRELGLGAGDHVQITTENGRMVLEPVFVAPKNSATEIAAVVDQIIEQRAGALKRLADL